MPQVTKEYKPQYVNTDSDALLLKQNESPYIKDYSNDVNDNGELATNTGNSAGNGGNLGTGTPLSGSIGLCNPLLPKGFNKVVGSAEFQETNELYVWYYNSNQQHGIYVISGDTMKCSKVIIDPNLKLSLDPAFAIPEHRATLRVVYDEDNGELRHVVEKHLMYTKGDVWQNWVNVIAAISSDGFNEVLFPYWKTRTPHFDRREYIEWAVRPPMYCPVVKPIAFTESDKGKINKLLNKSVQFAYQFIYTDGRATTFSPWSLPYYLTSSSCNPNSSNLSRCLELTLYAGSAMVEQIRIIVRNCNGDWRLYDTINRFDNCGNNDPSVIGNEYWKRTNQWADFSFDPAENTIKYKWCGDKEGQIFSQEDAKRFQTDLSIKSIALTSAGDAALLANNLYGYDNLDCRITDGIKLTAVPDPITGGCKVDIVKLSLYSYMGSDTNMRCQFAYKHGENATETFFGGYYTTYSRSGTTVNSTLEVQQDTVNGFGMSLGNKEGFLMYLAGTPYVAIGKQYQVNADGSMVLAGVINIDSEERKNYIKAVFNSGGYFVMKYEFEVPKGKYIARLAGHKATVDSDYTVTSTWVMGIANSKIKTIYVAGVGGGFPPTLSYGVAINFNNARVTYSKEREIDGTAGDVDVWNQGADLFYIFCPYRYDSGALIPIKRWRFNDGFVYEKSTTKIGVELLTYNNNHGDGDLRVDGFHTDHNGFFFAYAARGESRYAEVQFHGKFNCVNNGSVIFDTHNGHTSGGFLGWGAESIYVHYDVYMADHNLGVIGDCNRVLVKGKITNCDGTDGIAGVAVTISRGTTAYTGSDGTFELIVHNSFEGIRRDRIYINAGGECLFYTCNCLAPDYINYSDDIVPCTNCALREYPVAINYNFKLVVGRSRSLKGGGRYGGGMMTFDLAGRGTWVNPLNTVDIPTFLQTGDYTPWKMRWDAPNGFGFDSEVAWVAFYRTRNLNFRRYIQWVGDKIEFLNTKGEAVDTTGGLIRTRITIQSLLDFNTENRFANTVKYQVQEGDIVRIYDNGDGLLFDPATNDGFLDFPILGTNYNDSVQTSINVQANGSNITFNPDSESDGKTIIIGYDKRLEALRKKCGFWIEIISPRDESEKEQYCEICGIYPVVNGEIINNVRGGILETWDTYYQNRFIKIAECTGKTFNHPFESSSITDFWGENCDSCGRLSVEDPQAQQRWYPDDVMKSDEFVNEGRVNGLGTFREKNRKQFKGQEWGGIIGIHAERNMIAVICQNDWFVCGYETRFVKTTTDGRLIAANLDSNMSDPNQKVGDNFGCEYDHTSTIVFHNGLCFWGDAKNRAVIEMNYQKASKISDVDNSGYFDAKFSQVIKINKELSSNAYLDELFDIIAGIDPSKDDYHLTFRKRNLNAQQSTDFINIEREIAIEKSETFVFSVYSKKWVRFSANIPEFYGKLKHAAQGMLMVSFKEGQGYGHNVNNAALFNSFFGFKVPSIFTVVCNEGDDNNKIFQAVRIECNTATWWIDKIVTNEANSYSYIPVKYFKKKENMLFAEILRDMNSFPSLEDIQLGRVMLLDGKRMFGQFARIRFVQYDDSLGNYFEVNKIHVKATLSAPAVKE